MSWADKAELVDKAEPADKTELEASTEEIIIVETFADLERTKTLKELKEMCLARGLSNVGKKSDLAKRLVSSV